jgi:predicted amidohydrolase
MARVALFQMTSGIDPQANADAIVNAVAQAKAGGAVMLFTPKCAG